MKYLIVLLVVIFTGCATISGYSRVPDQITEWFESNSWRVETPNSGGTGFWVDGQFLTACHIVKRAQVAYIHNIDRSRLTLARVESCNQALDMAVLVPIDSPNNTIGDFEPLPIKLAEQTPPLGTLIYSAGFPMSGPFGYANGVLNSLSDNGYETSIYLIYGASGSPVVAVNNGRIELVGIMLQFNTIIIPVGDTGDVEETEVFGSSLMHGIEDIKTVLDT